MNDSFFKTEEGTISFELESCCRESNNAPNNAFFYFVKILLFEMAYGGIFEYTFENNFKSRQIYLRITSAGEF